MVLYHRTDSSSKHSEVNLHNISIRCKASGLQKDSGDQYLAAGIGRTLNGSLVQCANSGNSFSKFAYYSFAHLFQRQKLIHPESEALCRGLMVRQERVFKGERTVVCLLYQVVVNGFIEHWVDLVKHAMHRKEKSTSVSRNKKEVGKILISESRICKLDSKKQVILHYLKVKPPSNSMMFIFVLIYIIKRVSF